MSHFAPSNPSNSSSSSPSSSFSSLPSSSRSILDHFSTLYHLPKSIADLESLKASASVQSSPSSISHSSAPGIPITSEVMETVHRDGSSMFSPWQPAPQSKEKERGKQKKKSNQTMGTTEPDVNGNVNGNVKSAFQVHVHPHSQTRSRRTRSNSSSSASMSRNNSPVAYSRPLSSGDSRSTQNSHPPLSNPAPSCAPSASTSWEEGRDESEKEREIFIPNKRRLSAQNEVEIWNALAGLKAEKRGSKAGAIGELQDQLSPKILREIGEDVEEKTNNKTKKNRGAGRGRSKSVIVTSMPACPPTPPPTPLLNRNSSEKLDESASSTSSNSSSNASFPASASFQRRFSMPSHMYYFSFDDEVQRNCDMNDKSNAQHSMQQQINGTPNEMTPLLMSTTESTGEEKTQKKEQQEIEHHMSEAMMKEIQEKVKALKLKSTKAKKFRQEEMAKKEQQQQQQQPQVEEHHDESQSSKKRCYSLPSAVDEWSELAQRLYGGRGNEVQEQALKGRMNDVSTQTEPSGSWLDEEIRQLMSSSSQKPSKANGNKPSSFFGGPIQIQSFESASRQPQRQSQPQLRYQQPQQQAQQPQRPLRPLLTECSLPHFAPSSALSFDAPTYSSLQNQRYPQNPRHSSIMNWSVPAMAQRGNYARKKELERRYSFIAQNNTPLKQQQRQQMGSNPFSNSSSAVASSTSVSAPASLSSSRRNSQSSNLTGVPSNQYVSIDALIKLAHRKEIESRYSARPLSLSDRERRRSAIYELEKEIEREANRKHTGLLNELFNSYQRNLSRPISKRTSQSMDSSSEKEGGKENEQEYEMVVWPSSQPKMRKSSLVSSRKRGEPVLSSSRRQRLARLDAEELANGH